ncbi:MAG TPA: protein kinase [Opitutales bacterium]|nr:protein kinase [Opitutales bacterium]
MDISRTCPRCGKPLAPDAPMGLCPACLLQAGFPTGAPSAATAATSARQSPAFVPPPPAELAALFPQLEIFELIGQGGMGAVYRARQPALDRMVALKILPPQTPDDPGFTERFAREARALARLGHPNIVAVYDFGRAGGFHYFVMEYVDGANLRQIERAGRLAPREALQIIPQICAALQFAHDEGIVHRDIKPENILLDKKGRVKIADFGLAKIFGANGAAPESAITQAGHVMGTPHYMAPEQVERPLAVDHRADIYSLGVVFYEMLTGELPLGRFAAPSQRAAVDARLDDVVMRALEKEPAQRYQQAGEVQTDLETIARGAPPKTKPPSHFAPGSFRRVAIWFFIGFGLAAATCLGYAFTRPTVYRATATFQLIRPADPGASSFDQNTAVSILKAQEITQRVAQMMSTEEKQKFLEPFQRHNPEAPDLSLMNLLSMNRQMAPGGSANLLQVSVRHPDPIIAATVADYYMRAFEEYNQSLATERAARAVIQLEEDAHEQQKKTADLKDQMDGLAQKYGAENLQTDNTVLPAKIQTLETIRANDQNALDAAAGRWRLVQQYQDQNKNLTDLSFIAANGQIPNLQTDLTNLRTKLSTLMLTYGPNHPDVQALRQTNDVLESRLHAALQSAAEQAHTDYLAALAKFNSSDEQLQMAQQEQRELSPVRARYDSLRTELTAASKMYGDMQADIEQQKMKLINQGENIVPVESARGNVTVVNLPMGLRLAYAFVCGVAGGLLAALAAGALMLGRSQQKPASA